MESGWRRFAIGLFVFAAAALVHACAGGFMVALDTRPSWPGQAAFEGLIIAHPLWLLLLGLLLREWRPTERLGTAILVLAALEFCAFALFLAMPDGLRWRLLPG